MTRARVARAVAAALAVGCAAASACRQADAAKGGKLDTAELAKREARLDSALGVVAGRGGIDTSAGELDATLASDTSSTRPATDPAKSDSAKSNDPDQGKGKRDRNADTAGSTGFGGAIARWVLPRDLDEISGIALTSDGRLLAHGDERGQISEIDYRRGVIVKQFVVGAPTLRADLEGITVVHGTVFVATSKGVLYEFREGANGTRVDYITQDTRLAKECEFEGLAYDPAINSLLLACKTIENKGARDRMRIFRWKLEGGGERLSRLDVPLSKILPSIGEKEFHPADITVDPKTGNYLIVASIEEALVEITPAGDVVFARKLTGEHNQPEAIAITKDNILIIGDEAGRRPAAITLYPWPR